MVTFVLPGPAASPDPLGSWVVDTGSPYHYSGRVFSDTVMIAGNATMPAVTGGTEVGHGGNGVAKFSILSRD